MKVYQRGLFGAIRVFRPVGPDEPRPGRRSPKETEDKDEQDRTRRKPWTEESRTTETPRAPSRTRRAGRSAPTEPAEERSVRSRIPRGLAPARRGGPGRPGGAGLRLAAAAHPAGDREGPGGRAEGGVAGGPRELKADYARDGRGLQLVEVAGGHQITTRPEYNDWVRELLDPRAPDAAVHPGPGDAGRHRLQAAGDPARDHRAARGEVGRRHQDAAREAADHASWAARRWWAARCCTARPRSSCSTSASRTWASCPKIEEFAEVLGEEVDVAGLKRAIEAPRPVEVPLSEGKVRAVHGPSGRDARRASRFDDPNSLSNT